MNSDYQLKRIRHYTHTLLHRSRATLFWTAETARILHTAVDNDEDKLLKKQDIVVFPK